jgi:hypothetical protein
VFDAGSVARLIERERISGLPGPPTLLSAILDLADRDAHDLSSLSIGFVGASSVAPDLLHRMRTELPFRRVTTGNGLTDASAMCSITRPDDPPDYVSDWNGGAPLADIRVKVVDDDGDGVPAGRPGELLIRGGNVMSGYLEDPEATAAGLDAGGSLHTGDIGVMNERGDIKITDRKKDIYICGGFNVAVLHDAVDTIPLALVDQRPERHLVRRRVAHRQVGRLADESLAQPVGDGLVHDDPVRRYADLALVEVGPHAALLAARSRSASSRTMSALLPPSSSDTFFRCRPASSPTRRPPPGEPVNATMAMLGSVHAGLGIGLHDHCVAGRQGGCDRADREDQGEVER